MKFSVVESDETVTCCAVALRISGWGERGGGTIFQRNSSYHRIKSQGVGTSVKKQGFQGPGEEMGDRRMVGIVMRKLERKLERLVGFRYLLWTWVR